MKLSEASHAIDLKAEMTSHAKILNAKQKKSLKYKKSTGDIVLVNRYLETITV